MDIKYKHKYLKYKKMYNQVINKDNNTEIIQHGGFGKTNRIIIMNLAHLQKFFEKANTITTIKKCHESPTRKNKYKGLIETLSFDDMQDIWANGDIINRPICMETKSTKIQHLLQFIEDKQATLDNEFIIKLKEEAIKIANSANKSLIEAAGAIPGSELYCINKVLNLIEYVPLEDSGFKNPDIKPMLRKIADGYVNRIKQKLLSLGNINVDTNTKYPVIEFYQQLPNHNKLTTELCKKLLEVVNNKYPKNNYHVIFYFTMHHANCNTIDGIYVSDKLLNTQFNIDKYIKKNLLNSYNYDNTGRNYMYDLLNDFASGTPIIQLDETIKFSEIQPNSRMTMF
jgi:hypothetical protein